MEKCTTIFISLMAVIVIAIVMAVAFAVMDVVFEMTW